MLTNCIKNYPISVLTTLVVIALSTCPIGTPEVASDVPLADKWTHMVMYAFLAQIVCWEDWKVIKGKKLFKPEASQGAERKSENGGWRRYVWIVLGCALLGGGLELVQAYLTTYRSGEWLDFVADTIGAVIGGFIIWVKEKWEFTSSARRSS